MTITRRSILGAGAGLLALPAVVRAETAASVRSNTSAFIVQDWRDHFDSLGTATIVADTGSGPDNPLGTHAMYLGWSAYIIHGIHDTRKIGRRSSDGCIGLFNENIAELFALCPIGTRVRVI